MMNQFLHSTIRQLVLYFWVFIVNPFSLLWRIFFSGKLCFLRSPCLLLITGSISLDTSCKANAGFFLKHFSPSWIILPISLDELNSIHWLLKSWWSIFLKWFLFYCYKRILIWQKILEVFRRTYLNIIFWILLWMLTSLAIWILLWVLTWNTTTRKP